MQKINALYQETTQQSAVLKEILLCIKGSESMNIEGIIPAQKRLERQMADQKEELEVMIKNEVASIEKTLNEINSWKQAVSIYFGLIMSKRVWRGVFIFVGIVAIILLSIKYGFQNVWHYIKAWFL